MEPVLKTSNTVLGQPIEYTKTDSPKVGSVMQVFQPGGETGWHYHIDSSHIYVLEGMRLELDRPSTHHPQRIGASSH